MTIASLQELSKKACIRYGRLQNSVWRTTPRAVCRLATCAAVVVRDRRCCSPESVYPSKVIASRSSFLVSGFLGSLALHR